MKCKECGCLAVWRNNNSAGDLFEATIDFREEGKSHQFSPIPFCVMRKHDFRVHGEGREVREALSEERVCDKFAEWMPGLSPQDHREHVMQMAVEESRRVWERKQEKLAHKRHVQSLKMANKSMYMGLFGAFLGALATLLAVFAGKALDLIDIASKIVDAALAK